MGDPLELDIEANWMLARRVLPPEFATWNEKWGAPSGRRGIPGLPRLARRARMDYQFANAFGPFAYQGNSSTRIYEFPWVYHMLRPRPGLRALEIGGALSGLQFVLARAGCEVHNVDPFFDYGGGEYQSGPERRHGQLNRAFKTDVKLHKTTLPAAKIDGPFDIIFSVSTLEHIPRDALVETLAAARRLLNPGGRIVLTVDLFLNLEPFCRRKTNQWGTNVPPRWIADMLDMDLAEGTPSELFGYDEFSVESILEHMEDYAISTGYPQMAQLMAFGTP
jgi:2-polyprenyl-3-methyl-5-hydroxy-6-metoxy-1,4-benzoquinol methylase